MTQPKYIEEARELLQHGGLATGLATIALAQNTEVSEPIEFRVLSSALTAGAQKVIAALDRGVSRPGIEAAISRALEHQGTVAPPQFALELAQSPGGLAEALTSEQQNGVHQIIPDFAERSGHDQGIIILACALCRARDSVLALARHLSSADARLLYRSACLAGAKTAPGLPSSLRRALRRLAREQT